MPYAAELSRINPTCILFLIDQSSSMGKAFGAQPDRPKAAGVADGINRLLQNLALKCAKALIAYEKELVDHATRGTSVRRGRQADRKSA